MRIHFDDEKTRIVYLVYFALCRFQLVLLLFDCDKNLALCGKLGINEFPKFGVMVEGNFNLQKGHNDVNKLSEFLETIELRSQNVRNLRTKEQLYDLSKGDCMIGAKACLVLLTSNYEPSLLAKSVMHQYRSLKFAVAEVRASNKVISQEFATSKYPVLIMICGNTDGIIAYEKFQKSIDDYELIRQFIDSFLKDKTKCSRIIKEKRDLVRRYTTHGTLSEKTLSSKKISEIRDIARFLGIEQSSTMLEKSDWILAILKSQK